MSTVSLNAPLNFEASLRWPKIFLLVLTMLIASAERARSFELLAGNSDSCEAPHRNKKLCYRMKQLHSQVALLDSQTQLMQVNFSFQQAMTDDLSRQVSSILTSPNVPEHVESLNAIVALAEKARTEAESRDLRTYQTSNQIQGQCLACHSNDQPSSGYKWEDISRGSWKNISFRCREPGRNPYTCKSMHALLDLTNYFSMADRTGNMNFFASLETAREIHRIAKDLESKNAVHGGASTLQQLAAQAQNLVVLSEKKDPAVFQLRSSITKSCARCHLH